MGHPQTPNARPRAADIEPGPAPAALVEFGRIQTGFFREPPRRVDMLAAARPRIPGGRLGRRLRLKEWVGFGICHPELYGGMLIQHAGYAASGTVYLYDRIARQLHEWTLVSAPWKLQMPEHLWQGETRIGRPGRQMHFEHRLDDGAHRIRIELGASRRLPALKVELDLAQDHPRVEPLVVSLPIGSAHHTYTHKAPLATSGRIRIGDRQFDFDPGRDIANLDEQKTFYPYRSQWMWGSFAVRTDEGRVVMLNLVNQMTPLDHPGEDAMWVDGRLQFLERPQFEPEADGRSWQVRDPEGRIRLRFEAKGAKRERMNLGLAAIDYVQHFGPWSGELLDADGHVHRIAGAWGAFEQMRARF